MSSEAINLAEDLLAAQKVGDFDEVIKIATALKELQLTKNTEWRNKNIVAIREFIENISVATTEAEWNKVLEDGQKLFCIDAPTSAILKKPQNKKTFTKSEIIAVFGKTQQKYSRAQIAKRLDVNPDRVQYLLRQYIGKEIAKEGELKSTKYFLTPLAFV